MPRADGSQPRVGLLVTCLVDLMRPSVGLAAAHLLEQCGCHVEVPELQTCCGQPAFNAGDRATSRALAVSIVEAFADFDFVVVPSGSCAAMVKVHYPALLADDDRLGPAAKALAERTHELCAFLVNVCPGPRPPVRHPGRVALHDPCSARRELGIESEPRRLLQGVEGLELRELADREPCCGFGGLFSIKYPDVSGAMAEAKCAAVAATGAELLVGPDLGCLLHLAGKLTRDGRSISCRHIAEILAGETTTPPIGRRRST